MNEDRTRLDANEKAKVCKRKLRKNQDESEDKAGESGRHLCRPTFLPCHEESINSCATVNSGLECENGSKEHARRNKQDGE